MQSSIKTLPRKTTRAAAAGIDHRSSLQQWLLRTARVLVAAVCAAGLSIAANSANAAPPIRIIPGNEVPTCVTPERLMDFLRSRNPDLAPQFSKIAHWYAKHGETWRVRWDYAFYQMALETNFLTYRRPNGKWGDVDPKQNNFAGLGTTGGGVPGDSYADVSTGVLAQLQHLIVYSGERLDEPVGHRTRLKQDVILKLSQPIAEKRPVTFQDLSGRWAVDKKYGASIESLARLYRERYCGGKPDNALRRSPRTRDEANSPAGFGTASVSNHSAAPNTRVAAFNGWNTQTLAPQPRPVFSCTVSVASFGGSKTLLIQSFEGQQRNLTALDVDPAAADEMAQSFIERYAAGGEKIGIFPNRRAALSAAYEMCPTANRG